MPNRAGAQKEVPMSMAKLSEHDCKLTLKNRIVGGVGPIFFIF